MDFNTGSTAIGKFMRDSLKSTIYDMEESFFEHLMLKGQEDIPPYCPELALEAVEVAKSYRDAISHTDSETGKVIVENDKYIYSGGGTFLDDGVVKDKNGLCRIDCSTYIHLIMRGIPFSKSPYAAEHTNNLFYAEDLITNWAKSWADDSLRASRTLSNALCTHQEDTLVRYAADLAAYYWATGRVFPCTDYTMTRVKPGDLVFYRKSDMDRFMHITHVGIVLDNETAGYHDTKLRMYNVVTNDPVVMISRVMQESRTIAFFARPDYEGIRARNLRPRNYLGTPWYLKDDLDSRNVIVRPDIPGGTIWTGTEGNDESTGLRAIKLFDENHPFYLPAGTYHLSGAPSHLDRRSEFGQQYWGLRVYEKNLVAIPFTQTGLSGEPYSEDNKTTAEIIDTLNKKIWDIGFGADFTLETGKWMCADIFIRQTPVDDSHGYSNTDPDTDIWRPSLISRSEAST